MGLRVRLALALGVVALSGAGLARAALACTIDGRPSLLVEGQRVLLNTAPPNDRNWAYWAQFVTAKPVPVHVYLALREDRRFVTLPAEAFHRPWRWRFGDGASPAYGFTISHRYAH